MSKIKNVKFSENGLNAFKLIVIKENLDHLLGEVLTIIDASTEGDKNKAMKDLVKDRFAQKHNWFNKLAWKELCEEGEGHSPSQPWESGLVPLEDKVYSYKQ